MSEEKWAIITGADGGMGTEITRAVAAADYHVIMACYHPEKAELVRQRLVNETGNTKLEVMAVDLSSMSSAASLADQILERHLPGNRTSHHRRRLRTYGERQLSGTVFAYPETPSGNDAWSAYCKYGFLHVRDWPSRFSGFLLAGKKGRFLAYPCL